MNKMIQTAVTIALVAGSTTALACDYPDRIGLPNGATAAKQDMIDGVNAIKIWQQALVDYRLCIEEETNASIAALADSDATVEEQEVSKFLLQKKLTEKHDASVDDEQRLAAEFNEQLGLYKNQNK